MVIGWYEMPEEDRPAERIWLDDEALTEHFERLRESRKSGASGMEPIEDVPLEDNELAASWRK